MPPPAEPLRRRLLASALAGSAAVLLLVPGAGVVAPVVAALAVLSALGLGLALIQGDPTLGPTASPFARLVVAAALGGGLLGQFAFLLAATGAWPRLTGPVLLVVPGLAFALPVTRPAIAAALRAPSPPGRRLGALLLLAGGWGLFLLVCAAVPPIDHDSLVYHLALPEWWLVGGRARLVPGFHYTAFPLAAEGAFTAALELGGPLAAKVLAWTFLPMVCAAAGLVAWRLLPHDRQSASAPIAAAVLLATVPAAAVTATLTYNDLWAAAFLILCVEALMRRAATDHPAPALEAGAFAGLALASKYIALVALPGIACAAAVLAATRRGDRGRTVRHAAAAVGLALFVGGPVYLRNLLLLGNPVYPAAQRFFVRWFGAGGPWDEVSARGARDALHGARSLSGLLRLPADIVGNSGRFGAGADPGPLLLLALPAAFAVLACRGDGRERRVAGLAAAAGMLVAWWATAMNGRYVLAALGMLCALGAAAAAALRGRVAAWTAAGLLAAGGTWGAARAAQFQSRVVLGPGLAFLAGREEAADYEGRRRPILAFYDESRRALPAGARVLLVGETRSFGLKRDRIVGSAYDPSPLVLLERSAPADSRGSGRAEAVREAMRSLGVTHVLVDLADGQRLDREYGHFRELGGGKWKTLLREALPGPPLRADPRDGIFLYTLPPPRGPTGSEGRAPPVAGGSGGVARGPSRRE